MAEHVQAGCFRPDTCGGGCMGCNLFLCTVCGGAEGSLTTDCCSQKLPESVEQQVYKEGLDYRDGKWVKLTCEKGHIVDNYHNDWCQTCWNTLGPDGQEDVRRERREFKIKYQMKEVPSPL